MKEEDNINYQDINLSGEVYNDDIVLYGGPPPPPNPRDPIEEPEGVDTALFPRPTDPSKQGKPPGGVSLSIIETIDIISEGPIDGLASGTWDYYGIAEETGYKRAKFTPFVPKEDGSPSPSGVFRAMFYNDKEIISKQGYRNFQKVNVSFTRGEPVGEALVLDDNSNEATEISRTVSERLRGPEAQYKGGSYLPDEMELKAGVDSIGRDNAKFYKVLSPHITAFKIGIKVGGLYYRKLDGPDKYPHGGSAQPVGKGDTKGTTVIYRLCYKPLFSNEAKQTDFFSRDDDGKITSNNFQSTEVRETIYGKTSQGYVRETSFVINKTTHKQTLQDEDFIGWEIAVYRETLDSFRASLANSTHIDSIIEQYDETFCYPNTAVIRSRFTADTFQGVPKRTFTTRGLKIRVPNNYNPILHQYGASKGGAATVGAANGGDAYLDQAYDSDGSSLGATTDDWDGGWKRKSDGTLLLEWTSNPAWIYYDLVTNPRYGLGKFIGTEQLDKWSLYKISRYCDGMVPNNKTNEEDGTDGAEPRFEAHVSLTNQDDAYAVLQSLASTFRGMTYYAGGQISATYDSPASHVYTFTNANVMDGDFIYSSSSKKSRHSVCLVRYNDKDDVYTPSIEHIEDTESVKKYGIRVKDLTAFGCTSKSQARRLARYVLATERLETQNVQFTAGMEASYLRPGDIVAISDSSRPTFNDLSRKRRGGRTFRPVEISSGTNNGINCTGRVFLDSSISGYVRNANIPLTGKINLHMLCPPSYVDPLTTDIADSATANNYIRKPAIQTFQFTKADVTETGIYGALGDSGIETRSYINITGDYKNSTFPDNNIFDDRNYNVTGFTGLLYDSDGEKIAGTGFVEQAPDNFVWMIEYPNFDLDWTPDADLYKIIIINQGENFKFNINAISHKPEKFRIADEASAPQEPPPLNFPDTPRDFIAYAQVIYGTHAKRIIYNFSPPANQDYLDGYKVYVKLDSDFDDTGDYLEDPYGILPDARLFQTFLPAGSHNGTFIPVTNGVYYFRIYSVNELGRTDSKSNFLEGTINVDGVNLLLDLQVQSLALVSDGHDNQFGRKDGDSLYRDTSLAVAWQAGFLGNTALLNLPIPNDFYWRVSFRRPVGPQYDSPGGYVYYEATGLNKDKTSYSMSIGANTNGTVVPEGDYAPFRDMDVVVEAVNKDGLTSAGGSIVYSTPGALDGWKTLTSEGDYSNRKGYDILYTINPPMSGIRLTDRLGTIEGSIGETCFSPASNNFCTDQWLEDDGTLDFHLTRDLQGYVTGAMDQTRAVFLLSKDYFSPAQIQGKLDQYIADDDAKDGIIDGRNSYVVTEGFLEDEDWAMSVRTPYKSITEEVIDTRTDGESLTHLYMAVSFVDNWLDAAFDTNPKEKSLLKKLVWSTNVVKIGPRNAFLKGSLQFRAWVIVKINWESKDILNWQGANIEGVHFGSYDSGYYVRKARSRGGKRNGTGYSTTLIQAKRKYRSIVFRDSLPSSRYEVVIFFSPREGGRYGSGRIVPTYGSYDYRDGGSPEIQVIAKSKNGFTIADDSPGGYGHSSNPRAGTYFIGVMLGTAIVEVKDGFGSKNADSIWNYVVDIPDNGVNSITTEVGTFNI